MTRGDNAIHVEAFELSPSKEAVNSTVGRLQRQFPGPSFVLDDVTFSAPGLQDIIAQTLATMSHQSVAETKPTKEAGQESEEGRDTTDPKMAIEFLTAFLRPCASIVESLQIHKNTREDVLWLNSRFPWRRSPLWLLLRVALQVILRRLCHRDGIFDDVYKHYMVYYMSSVLNGCLLKETMSDEQIHFMNAKIARRSHKLGLSQLPAWYPFVQNVLQKAYDSITKGRRGVIAQSGPRQDKDRLAKLDFGKDIYREDDCELLGLAASLKQTSFADEASPSLVSTTAALTEMIESIEDLPTSPPSLYVDLEGVKLSRHRTISILQIYVSPHDNTYLVDVHTLNGECFTHKAASGTNLKMILDSPSIPKVIFDVRHDSDALYGHFRIDLAGVQDLQLIELATRTFPKRRVNSLTRCIENDADMTFSERQKWKATKEKGLKLFAPERGGSYEVFNTRPLAEEIIEYCVQDVRFLPKLW
ncbi:ribonuclease H-like domain-containing protein [Aspergillus oleicola]